jgi:hypothetical protein
MTPHDDMYNEKDEDAYEFGYVAYRHFGQTNTEGKQCWDEPTEEHLRNDWGADFDRQRTAIQRGWDYNKMQKRAKM